MKSDINYRNNDFKTELFTWSIRSHFYMSIDNIHMAETVSENVDICPSFIFIPKHGKILIIFYDHFSSFQKTCESLYL